MEVDRIWRIDGLDGNANPAWQNSARRRRRFVEEVAPPEEEFETGDAESAAEDQSSEPDRRRFSTADNADSPVASTDAGASFRVTA